MTRIHYTAMLTFSAGPAGRRCASLTEAHDELRRELAKATLEPGLIGELTRQTARLCLPHFDVEQRVLFPLFNFAGDFHAGNLPERMDEIHGLIVQFDECRADLYDQHQSMNCAVDELWLIACEDGHESVMSLTRSLRKHETIEEEIVYPAVFLLSNYCNNRFVCPR
jgi:hypothetical protein